MSTPLMKQYSQIKAQYPDTVLLFRMGDFFETFEQDAQITSRVLGITLTRRGNGAAGEVPLAGFPHHALDAYLPRLLKAGYRVAVCEQMEDPRFAKGIVKREVVEVATPGVAFSDKVLQQKQNNYLAAVALPSPLASGSDTVGIAFADVSTGEFRAGEFPLRVLAEQITSLVPSELLVQRRDEHAIREVLRSAYAGLFTVREDWVFSTDYGRETLLSQLGTQTLKGFGIDDLPAAIAAAGAIVNYLQETQKSNFQHIRAIVPHVTGDTIVLDPSTKRNLEIISSMAGSQEGTLFQVLDRTLTPMGGRLLKHWVNNPLKRVPEISRRLEAVENLVGNSTLRESVAGTLTAIGDLERLTAKICTGRATPREVIALKGYLIRTGALREALGPATAAGLTEAASVLSPLPDLAAVLEAALEPDPPALLADGGVIRKGYNPELDDLRSLSANGKQWIIDLQRQERDRTGISSLKVGFNNVFGYYIEITNTHKEKIPADFIRKQTLTNAERYITPELKEYEDKILHAEERILALESSLFAEIRMRIAQDAEAIQRNARAIALLDCYTALAGVAVDNGYVKPEINESTVLDITAGRHPVIERFLPPGEKYTPNDVHIDTADRQILIITGPNMSGKSSYLRMSGLIVLLAQIGSYVPAQRASVGVVDRIFTRVGASDNIASGESTFLVEMHEAAHIVNAATDRSLILLDEVGRGTSTFDGISIAWALTEYLHTTVGARTLFATHYHELNELADLFPRIRNVKVDVREYGDKVVFLHTVSPGTADHSYGIHVARMAGLPESVTDRAQEILSTLEGADLSVGGERRPARSGRRPQEIQMTLFEGKDDALRAEIASIDLNRLTPLEALQVLAALKAKLDR
jgi:DNA mismatch repair protein MutS